jgi:hypothetical protein
MTTYNNGKRRLATFDDVWQKMCSKKECVHAERRLGIVGQEEEAQTQKIIYGN